MRRKILSTILALCMVMSMLPMTAFAYDGTVTVTFNFGTTGITISSGTAPTNMTVDSSNDKVYTVDGATNDATFVLDTAGASLDASKAVKVTATYGEDASAVTEVLVADENGVYTLSKDRYAAAINVDVSVVSVYSVSGKVIVPNDMTGVTVDSLDVKLYAADDTNYATVLDTVNPSDGVYTFTGVEAGSYVARIEGASGSTPAYVASNSKTIVVSDANIPATDDGDSNITLVAPTATYSVSGKVIVPNGMTGVTVDDLDVSLYAASDTTYETALDTVKPTSGTYTFTDVEAGSYVARIEGAGGSTPVYVASNSKTIVVSDANIPATDDGDSNITLVAPSTDPAAEATGTLTVTDGAVTAVDITVTLKNTAFVAEADFAKVTAPITVTLDNKPVAVTVERTGDKTAKLTAAAPTNPDQGAGGGGGAGGNGNENTPVTVAANVVKVTVSADALTTTGPIVAVSEVTVDDGSVVPGDDAGLSSVLGVEITKFDGGDGTTVAKAKTAAINVPNAKDKVLVSDVTPTNESATVKLYTDGTFTTEAVAGIPLEAGKATPAGIEVTSGETSCYYVVTITRLALSKDTTVTNVAVGGYSAVAGENNTNTFAATIPANAEPPVTLATATVTLKVPTTASSVKYAVGDADAAATDNTLEWKTLTPNPQGEVSQEVDLSAGKKLFVEVTAQDGTTKTVYTITATQSEVSDAAVVTPTPDYDTSWGTADAGDKTAAENAAGKTNLNVAGQNALKDAAFQTVADTLTKDPSLKGTAETELKALLDDQYVDGTPINYFPIASMKVSVGKPVVDKTSGEIVTYVVDIKPVVQLVATQENDVKDVDLDKYTNAVKVGEEKAVNLTNVTVEIGVPSFIAADKEYVKVTHIHGEGADEKTTNKIKKVDVDKVAIEVPNFSTFKITKATEAGLDNLTVTSTDGNTIYDLTPAFDMGQKDYKVEVENSVAEVKVNAEKPDGFSVKMTANDQNVTVGNAITLDAGKTTKVIITVTQDGVVDPATPLTATYTVEITRAGGGGGGGSIGGGGGGVSSNVTIDRTTNGKVTVTPTAPSKGATVTINLTPDTGYQVGTVTVTDKDGKAVELTKVDDTHYTFVMPDGKVTVKATFTAVATTPDGFTDVDPNAYYADAVKWAVDKGITNGLTATTFGPNNSCTRGQMVTFLWRAAGSPAATGTNSFTDVDSSAYYYNAVLWAVEKNITNGTTSTTFSPNATVNRGQTVTFLYRYAESPAATGDSSFTDVAADAYYADAVKWAVAEEITNGTSATTFAPSSNCTRGQIVTFLYRQMAE